MSTKFLVGALAGLVAGLLLAPKKGEDLRNDIADTAGEWKKKLQKMGSNAGAELSDLRSILEDEISGLSDDVRSRILTILDETKETAHNVKNVIASEMK